MNKCKSILAACFFLQILLVFAYSKTLDAAERTNATYTAVPGQYQVDILRFKWNDQTRNREVPVKIYYPKTGEGPFPLIIFSHGLGGSSEGYEYLGRHWASHGYIVVHPQHHGSDSAVWQNTLKPWDGLLNSAKDPSSALNRARDVSFVIDQIADLNNLSGPLKDRIDMQKIGMSGHSFGAWATLAVSGQESGLKGGKLSMADPRIKAAIAMSAPVVVTDKDRLDKIYANFKIPCMQMTGTLDDSPIGETKAKDRRLPFDHIHAPDQYLIILNGGDHYVFGGFPKLPGMRKNDPAFIDIIKTGSTVFWDAYLKGSRPAKKWLTDGGLKETLGKNGSIEIK